MFYREGDNLLYSAVYKAINLCKSIANVYRKEEFVYDYI